MRRETRQVILASIVGGTAFITCFALVMVLISEQVRNVSLSLNLGILCLGLFFITVTAASLMPRDSFMIFAVALVSVAVAMVFDAFSDTTGQRNLWPFEVIIGVAISTPPALAGTAIGCVVSRRRSRRRWCALTSEASVNDE
jgi:hypothetical protein